MRALVLSLLLAVAAAIVLAPGPVVADPHRAAPAEPADPPAGRVGRIATVDGTVSVRFPGENRWSDAERNDPIAAGSAVQTAGNSRAVVEIGGDMLSLAAGTEIDIPALDGHSLDLVLSHGRIGLALARLDVGESVEIDLAQGGLWLVEPGDYTVGVGIGSDGQMPQIAAFIGAARLFAGGAEIGIEAGDAVRLVAADPCIAEIAPAAADDFTRRFRAEAADRWRLAALHGVPPDLTGAAALDAAGTWHGDSRYGWVWLPDSLPADWAPYRQGHWRWIRTWGWTWIAARDWGFATGHYGRWARIDGSWGWVPGKFVARPVFAPALVAFLGTPGIGVSYAGGNGPAIGWFPLAPGEAYWPGYTGGLLYIRALNRGAIADPEALGPQPDGTLPVQVVGRVFANRLAASIVPRPVFAGGRAVPPALLHLPRRRLAVMPVVMGSPRITPARPRPPPIPATSARHPPAPTTAPMAKSTAWVKAVATAAARSQRYQNAARAERGHAAASAAPFRPRHALGPKAAHAQPARPAATTRKPSGTAHKKVVER